MVNKYKQVVCDVTKIILNDGVTLYPGYVEAKKTGEYFVYHSNDTNNALPYRKKGKRINLTILRNRLKDSHGRSLVLKVPAKNKKLKKLKKTMHFKNLAVMIGYLT